MKVRVFLGVGVAVAAFIGAPSASASWSADTSCRAFPVDADPVIHSDAAREVFGVDGTGVTVGVLSDSFAMNQQPGTTVADNIASGALPGPENPCGHLEPVSVLRDAVPSSSRTPTDEGRAMVQVVHGIAPGASLMFAAVDLDNVASLREGIRQLTDAGADVIVDDASLEDDSIFQRSLTGEEIVKAIDEGVAYFSSAGNDNHTALSPREGQLPTPIGGWQTGAYRPMPCPDSVVKVVESQQQSAPLDCMNFAQNAVPDPTLGYTARYWKPQKLHLQWGAPAITDGSAFVPVILQNGAPLTDAPLTPLQDGTPGYFLTMTPPHVVDIPQPIELEVVIARVAPSPEEATTPPLFVSFPEEVILESAEYWQSSGNDYVGRTILGHNSDPAVISVAAADYSDTSKTDDFSGHGPSTIFFTPRTDAPPSQPVSPPTITPKPDITGVDGIRVNVAIGLLDADNSVPFHGTSAAAPVAAGVAALAKSANPALTQEDIRALFTTTATPITSPFASVPAANISGAGLINAEKILALVPHPAPSPTPSPTLSPTSSPTQTPVPTFTPRPSVSLPGPTSASEDRLAASGIDTSGSLALAVIAAVSILASSLILLINRRRLRNR